MKRVLEIVRPGHSRRAPLADDSDVVYIVEDGGYRLGDPDRGAAIDSDDLLDAIFAADLTITW